MSEELKQVMRQSKLRMTAQRSAVLEAVANEGKHQDAEFILSVVRKRLGSLSRQAVYDNLNVLVELGLVRRIEPAGSPALYETRVGDNHHHLICRACHLTVDIDCAVGAAPCLEPCELHGFAVDEAEVVYWGLCPSCRQNS